MQHAPFHIPLPGRNLSKVHIIVSGRINRNVYFPVNWEDKWPDFARAIMKYQREGKNAHDDAQDATTGVYENLPKKKATSNYTPIFM